MGGKRKDSFYMLMALGGNTIFGFSFLFTKAAISVAAPFVLLAVRFTAAFLIMTALKLTGVFPIHLKGRSLRPLIVLGLLEPVMYFIFETYGLANSPTSFAGIIIALIPIAGVACGALFLKERPTTVQLFFSQLSVLGVIVMTAMDDMMGIHWKGFLLLLGAVFSSAFYNVQNRRIAYRYSAFERTYVMFGVSAAVFISLALLTVGLDRESWLVPLTDRGFWTSIVYLSCVSSIGAFVMINKALEGLPIARSLVFANVTTVISVLAGVLILKESFSYAQLIGIVMVLIGVYGVNRAKSMAKS